MKNSLALRAAKDTPLEKLAAKFEGTTGVAYTGDDPVALAKVLVDFAKDHPALVVQGRARLGQPDVLDAAGVKALSTMPGLPELRAQAAGPPAGAGHAARPAPRHPGQPDGRAVLKAHQDKLEGK